LTMSLLRSLAPNWEASYARLGAPRKIATLLNAEKICSQNSVRTSSKRSPFSL
jgi:hypothetical protein